MTWAEKAMLYISRSVSRPEHICGVFIALAGLSKVIAKKLLVTFHGLKWPWPLATCWRVTGRNISTLCINSTCNPIFESLSNGFLLKQAPFIFSRWLIGYGEVAKLTWPWVIDIKNSEIYILWILVLISIAESFKVIDNSVWLWRAFKLFLRWGHLTWPGDLTADHE